MKSIFVYGDYRALLADYYAARKARDAHFSYAVLSADAGFANKGFIFHVMHGKRNLSKRSAIALARAMNLSKPESRYFENLVLFNQAKDFRQREIFFEQMTAANTATPEGARARRIRKDQFAYFSQWYHSSIRALIELRPFKEDYKWLAGMVFPKITVRQARNSVRLLERLELIRKRPDDVYELEDKVITTGANFVSLAVQKFHIRMAELASESIKALPTTKRNITGLTLGISGETYEKMCQYILDCQEHLLAMAAADDKADQVFRMNFQFFPISRRVETKDN